MSKTRLMMTGSFHCGLTMGTQLDPFIACIITWSVSKPMGPCSASSRSQSNPRRDSHSVTSAWPIPTKVPMTASPLFNLSLSRFFNRHATDRLAPFCKEKGFVPSGLVAIRREMMARLSCFPKEWNKHGSSLSIDLIFFPEFSDQLILFFLRDKVDKSR